MLSEEFSEVDKLVTSSKEGKELIGQLEESFKKRVDRLISKGWIERRPRGDYWRFLMVMRRWMILADMDSTSVKIGSKGAGKTNQDLLEGAIFDDTIDEETIEERAIYTSEDLHNFYDDAPRFTYAWIDEGGTLFSSRDSQSKDARSLIRTMVLSREGLNRWIQVNVPYLKRLDIFLRQDEVRFLTRAKTEFNPETLLPLKGELRAWSRDEMLKIQPRRDGSLYFPRPTMISYAPPVVGGLWRRWKEFSSQKKIELRHLERDKVTYEDEEIELL